MLYTCIFIKVLVVHVLQGLSLMSVLRDYYVILRHLSVLLYQKHLYAFVSNAWFPRQVYLHGQGIYDLGPEGGFQIYTPWEVYSIFIG